MDGIEASYVPLTEEEIRRARRAETFSLAEVDIDTDPELTARFGRSIPVLEIAGRVGGAEG